MRSQSFKNLIPILFAIFLINISAAQTVTEPPIPIQMTYQKDKSDTPYKDSLLIRDLALANANKQIDSLNRQIMESSEENSSRLTSFYSIIAFLGVVVIILLFLIFRTRKDLSKTKR